MSKTVVIHQPDFIPYLGFFHRLLHADLFVVLDNVQFLREGWHHRDKIKTYNGEKWHTIRTIKAPLETKINQIYLYNDDNWKQNNLNQIKENYKKTKFFDEIFPYLEIIYSKKISKLWEFNMESICILNRLFDIKIEMIVSSKFNLNSKSNQLLVDLLKRAGATHYLSGIGAKDYHDDKPFKEANIKVVWQDFKHPVYPQLHGEFIPYLSSIDLLFNCGIKKSREILRSI